MRTRSRQVEASYHLETHCLLRQSSVHANSNNLDAMRGAVMATFDHATSTDEKPHHDRCPVGADSWFFYQKSVATPRTTSRSCWHTTSSTPVYEDLFMDEDYEWPNANDAAEIEVEKQ